MSAPAGEGCKLCRFYTPQSKDQGLCQKHSPAVSFLAIPRQDIATGGVAMSVQAFGGWPSVPETSWCGEFEHMGSMLQLN